MKDAVDDFGEMLAADVNVPGRHRRDVRPACAGSTPRSTPGEVGEADVPAIRDAFARFDQVLGVMALRRAEEAAPPVPVDEIERLIEERRDARRRRDFAEADRIRKTSTRAASCSRTHPSGTRWKRRG